MSLFGRKRPLDVLEEVKQILGVIMSEQSDINAAVTEFGTLLADLQAQTASLVTDLGELQTIIASGQPVDTSALDAAVASATAVQEALDSAVANISTEVTPAGPQETDDQGRPVK